MSADYVFWLPALAALEMNRTRFLLIVIVTLRSSLLNAEQDVIPSCGDCAVFSLVRLCGKPAKLTEVVANCEHDETRGMSIAGVRQGIEKFGIQTVAVKYSPTQLDQVPLPCVLYFRPGRWDPRNTQSGHFLTVASRDDKTLKARSEEHTSELQ